VLVEVARRELRGVLERTQREGHGAAVRGPDREPPDVREAGRIDRDHDPGLGLAWWLAQDVDEKRADGDDGDDDARADDQAPPDHACGAAPVLPGA
jgi:hypothetical protein